MFQGLLGRLNGKSDEVLKKEEGYRRDLRLKEMVVKRFGGTTFVSGGFLVGDRMERTTPITSHATDVAGAKRKEKKSKKRKRVDAGDNGATAEDTKREKLSESSEEDILERERRKAKKEKKLKTNVVPQIVAEEEGIDGLNPTAADSQAETAGPSEKELKRQRKMERNAAK
jgi:Pin2-interacting protein X1